MSDISEKSLQIEDTVMPMIRVIFVCSAILAFTFKTTAIIWFAKQASPVVSAAGDLWKGGRWGQLLEMEDKIKTKGEIHPLIPLTF